MTRYQWTVLFAAWLGWGFDAFDGLLFNYVARSCVPDLLGVDPLGAQAGPLTVWWTGALTSLLLVGWAVGGIAFGKLADRIGRSRTLIVTILVYSLGTAATALAPNIGVLALCRLITSLGIGGEWAAGAAMVAEVVPEKKRLQAAAILYSAAPAGIFAAGFVSEQALGSWFAGNPHAWRYVFALGLMPAALAIVVRRFIKEPEMWLKSTAAAPRLAELFQREMRVRTLSGTSMAVAALLTWWSCGAFLPLAVPTLAREAGVASGLTGEALNLYVATARQSAIHLFNLGGLLGVFAGLPLARYVGRRATFGAYFLVSAVTLITTFGLSLSLPIKLGLLFIAGLATYGALGSFTYYLPELFPTRLRATASGFCYNVGRFITALGPFLIGSYVAEGRDTSAVATVMPVVGLIPLLALFFLPWVIETRGWTLEASASNT